MEAAEVWTDKNGTKRNLAFERWWPHSDGDGDRNAPPPPQWASEMDVWGNYELSDGDMVRGWISGNPNWDKHKSDFQARVHGDGISGQRVWISCANKPRTNLIGNYWCKVVPDTGAFHTLRREIQKGAAWPIAGKHAGRTKGHASHVDRGPGHPETPCQTARAESLTGVGCAAGVG